MAQLRKQNSHRSFEFDRDAAGIPHVTAPSWLDALFGLGYVHAVDRCTQILFSRAVASGRAAEQISNQKDLLETDRFFRRIGLHLDLDRDVSQLPDKTFRQLTAYCEGLNLGLNETGRSLPMWATGFVPDPWDQRSVLLVGKLLSFGGLAISQLQNERLMLELIHSGVNEKALRELFAPHLDSVDFELLRRVQMSNQLSSDALELLADLPRLAGSNAWAVSPDKSATGHALLASDPHLEVNRLPSIWYEAVLSWDDQYVMGATLPGCPLFAVGRTPKLAWGVTYMKGDTVDFFVEDCRRGGQTGWQYRRGKTWHDFDLREEPIERKGADAELYRVYENDQGTIDQSLDAESEPASPEESYSGEGLQLSVAWTGRWYGGSAAISAWLDVATAPSAIQAMDIVRDCPQPTLCFVFADGAGHIGLQGCGTFPRRPDPKAGLLPLAAWDAGNHWQGCLDKDLLPRIYDPPQGFVSSANEGWNPPNGPLLVTQICADYRKRRIDERLTELDEVTLDDMEQLQYDVLSLQARELLEVILPLMPEGSEKQRLADWDFRYDIKSKEATLYQRFYIYLMMEVFGHDDALGWRRTLYLCTRAGYSTMVLTAADRLLKKSDSEWWKGRDKQELVGRAVKRLENVPDQEWGSFNVFHFSDRFFGDVQGGSLLGFHSGALPMPGCHATPFQGHVYHAGKREQTFAPSYHLITDMGSDECWTNLPGGPSESRFSKNYKSDVDRWFLAQYKRLAVD